MARHEDNFRPDADAPLTLNELLILLGESGEGDDHRREDAIACYLSGGDGWREAMKLLGGAFADAATGLKERKAD